MMFHAAAQRADARRQADRMEAVSMGYSGAKTEKGSHALSRLLAFLRR